MRWYVKFSSSPKPSIFIHYQYDCLVFDGMEHVRIANLPGMWDRTITVGSAGSKHTAFSPLEL
jgi:aspartate/methionine/tyrosine aminotransferase